jgi:RNA-directed DNA polymerase
VKGESKALSPMTMEEIADEKNLKTAFRKVAANRGAPGPDRQTIDEVRKHRDACLAALRLSLLDGTYRAGDIRRVWIPKASGGQRGLGIPNVIDRVVQQAVHQVLSPRYEPTFHDGSHGFRPGRSCHTAIKRAKEYLEEGCDWVVDIDLAKFFDEVNHDRLMSRLEQRIADRRVLRLIRQMLRAPCGAARWGRRSDRTRYAARRAAVAGCSATSCSTSWTRSLPSAGSVS